jgi:hypothetical protein
MGICVSEPLSTRETVLWDTPARSATSRMVIVLLPKVTYSQYKTYLPTQPPFIAMRLGVRHRLFQTSGYDAFPNVFLAQEISNNRRYDDQHNI